MKLLIFIFLLLSGCDSIDSLKSEYEPSERVKQEKQALDRELQAMDQDIQKREDWLKRFTSCLEEKGVEGDCYNEAEHRQHNE